jgi:hypothetical protein
MSYVVKVLKVGEVEVPGPEIFWMSEWDKWFPLSINVLLIRGDGVTALVNTGAPDDLTPINELWTAVLGERATLTREPEQQLLTQLEAEGVGAEDVTHVVVTPFQLYTTAGIPYFTNAEICLSKRGWVHLHTTHSHPHDSRWHSISQEVLVHLVTDAWERVRLLNDEDTIAAGLRAWWAGTHHRASIAVEIDTPAGVVVASDAFFYYENVEENRLLGINENMYEALRTNERVLKHAAHIVPLYDPKVFDRYPNGVVSR